MRDFKNRYAIFKCCYAISKCCYERGARVSLREANAYMQFFKIINY